MMDLILLPLSMKPIPRICNQIILSQDHNRLMSFYLIPTVPAGLFPSKYFATAWLRERTRSFS